MKIETVEFDEKLAKKNIAENDFSGRDDGGLTPEQIEEVKKDLEARNADN